MNENDLKMKLKLKKEEEANCINLFLNKVSLLIDQESELKNL